MADSDVGKSILKIAKERNKKSTAQSYGQGNGGKGASGSDRTITYDSGTNTFYDNYTKKTLIKNADGSIKEPTKYQKERIKRQGGKNW